MREIKFRAWDTLYGCWFNGFYVDWQSGEVSWKLKDGTAMGKAENIELTQYTGLRDKNGKEIYEGDIVNTVSEPTFITYEVIYRAPSFLLRDKFGTFPFNPMASERHYTVIGNIYENPELLKERK